MRELEPKHVFAINAVQGWLELGNAKEAKAELQKLEAALPNHPAVLETRWNLFAHQNQWEEALSAALSLLRQFPEHPAGWINQSYSLHELNRTREAWEALLPAAKKFPLVATIPYNLACYACQLGRHTLALEWAAKASRLMGSKQLRAMAAKDKDLAPIRDEIWKLR